MAADADEFRSSARQAWDDAAGAWERGREVFQRGAEPVSRWLVEHLELEDGATVLELAAGAGDTGFLAAKEIGPMGTLISTDGSPEMVEVAKRRAAELNIANADFRVLEAEWLDLDAATVDAVVCRWGYMLLLDPEAALRETRRVLRPGGHVALAAWDAPERNPMLTTMTGVLLELGLTERPDPDVPGPFSFSAPGTIEELLQAAGFQELVVETVPFSFTYGSADEYFEIQAQMSPGARRLLPTLSPADHTRFRDALDARLVPFTADDGTVTLEASALVAAAAA